MKSVSDNVQAIVVGPIDAKSVDSKAANLDWESRHNQKLVELKLYPQLRTSCNLRYLDAWERHG